MCWWCFGDGDYALQCSQMPDTKLCVLIVWSTRHVLGIIKSSNCHTLNRNVKVGWDKEQKLTNWFQCETKYTRFNTSCTISGFMNIFKHKLFVLWWNSFWSKIWKCWEKIIRVTMPFAFLPVSYGRALWSDDLMGGTKIVREMRSWAINEYRTRIWKRIRTFATIS